MLKLDLGLIDGGAADFPISDRDYRRLEAALHDGVIEWDDFTELTTDDWGAPPIRGHVTGTLENRTRIDLRFGIGDPPRRRRR